MPNTMIRESILCRISLACILLTQGIFCFQAKIPSTAQQNTNILLSSKVTNVEEDKTKKVVVIGGGWAGFSAAEAVSTANQSSTGHNVTVELLDASPRGPGGLAAGWRSKKLNASVEAGLHGFWRGYSNTFAAIERIGLDLDDVLTPYMPSILVSQSGRVALAPVLGEDDNKRDILEDMETLDWSNTNSIIKRLAGLLPPPLDVAILSEFEAKNPLTIADRISAIGLLGVWADFIQEDPKSWKRYDKISADNLFRSTAGVSQNLYQELVSPLLHVLPMTPGYDCSAAAALSCFHVFALQARGAFDVRWCRGTISGMIFNPWSQKLLQSGNVNIRGSAKVTGIEERHGEGGAKTFIVQINEEETIECDAIILAVGGNSMKKLLPCSPVLANLSNAPGWKKFRGVTCVAVRLFFNPSEFGSMDSISNAMRDSPVVVCGPNIGEIPSLVETGFCIYDLQRLQDEFSLENKDNGGSKSIALEVDFFRADELANIDDDMEVARITISAVAAALDIAPIDPKALRDVSVVRARDAVSHFCVDSASWSPQVKLRESMYICGDWIDRTGHASWSTEKAVVTGRQAAASLAEDFGLTCETNVIPAAPDTSQLSALREVTKAIRNVPVVPVDSIPSSPWVTMRQMLGPLFSS